MINFAAKFFFTLSFVFGDSGLDKKVQSQAQCFTTSEAEASKSDRKYRGLQNLFQKNNIPKSEVLARLISSETKAAGYSCQKHAKEISRHIASVLDNRIRKRGGDIYSVIFEPSQFASSLHLYDESAIKDFLCPGLAPAWPQAMQSAREIEAKRYTNTLSPTSVNYYLFKHSSRFKPPKWTKKHKEFVIENSEFSDCIRFYENKNFK